MKQVLSLLLALVLCLSLCACGKDSETEPELPVGETAAVPEEEAPVNPFADIAVGDEVSFGSYYRGSESDTQPIVWYVLDIQDGKALLLSKYVLEPKKNESVEDGWFDSMPPYMNMLANRMFTDEEKAQILLEEIDGQKSTSYLFLLNAEEVDTYMPETSNKLRHATPTGYAIDEGVKVHDTTYCNWMLRDGCWVGGQMGNKGKIVNTT